MSVIAKIVLRLGELPTRNSRVFPDSYKKTSRGIPDFLRGESCLRGLDKNITILLRIVRKFRDI